MDGSGRAPPYEEDYSLPSYDYENLFLELATALKDKNQQAIQKHVIHSNYLIEMEEIPMLLMVKYCILVAAQLGKNLDWETAQVRLSEGTLEVEAGH